MSAKPTQRVGVQHSALEYAVRSRSRPSHALQESAPVNAVVVVVELDFVFRTGQH